MNNKSQGYETIKKVMAQYQISNDELVTFLTSKPSAKPSSLLVQLLAYLGGVLVFGGVCIFVAMQWEEMNSLTRVLSTLGSGFVAFVMAILILSDKRYEKLITPLFIVSALLELGGMFVLLDEYFTPTGQWEPASMLVHSMVGLQFALAFYALRRDALLFVSIYCLAAFVGSSFEHMNVDEELIALTVGTGLLVAAYLVQQTRHVLITPLVYFFGALMFLIGLFEVVEKSYGEVLYVLANIGLVYMSIYVRSRTLLFVSIVGFFSYISYTAYEYFVDSIGWPIALIIMGLFLFGLSALGIRINEKYLKS